jgi:hypothetical protein
VRVGVIGVQLLYYSVEVRFGVTVVSVVCVLLWKYGAGARVGLVFSFVCEVLFQYEEHENCVQQFVISCGP